MAEDSIHRFLPNNLNLVTTADVTANKVKDATNSVFTTEIDREGTGSVGLIEAYTGDEDCTIDIEIVADSATTKTISDYTFEGVGNGLMTEIASSGLDTQDVSVVLIDLGTQTTYAGVDFFGVTLYAVTPAEPGNSISIAVAESGITKTDTNYSTLASVRADLEKVVGEQWDFGAYTLDTEGNLNPNTKRLAFGSDPQIIRQYKKYENNKWNYYFSPPPPREIPAGSTVKEVTGTYTVTITDGVTTETYSNIVTLYDLLYQILQTSTLLTVDGVVADDTAPGGMAAIDLPLRTLPYYLPLGTLGSDFVEELTDDDLAIVLDDDSPTESVYLTCINNDLVGQEEWTVRGQISGLRANTATTGVTFLDPGIELINFKIPVKENTEEEDRFRVKSITYASRDEGEEKPPICVDPLILCAAAGPKTITLKYKAKDVMAEDCECDNVNVSGHVSPECCGIYNQYSEGGDILEAHIKKRFAELHTWADTFIKGNSLLVDEQGAIGRDNTAGGSKIDFFTAVLTTDRVDIRVCQRIVAIFQAALESIADHVANNLPDWTALTAYDVDDLVGYDITGIRHYYKCTVAGTTGAVAPSTVDYSSFVDGSVTWQHMGPVPVSLWDDFLSDAQTLLNVVSDQDSGDFWKTENMLIDFEYDYPVYQVAHTYNAGDKVIPTTPNGWYYHTIAGGSSGAEPTWPTGENMKASSGTCDWTAHRIVGLTDAYIQELDDHIDDWLEQFVAQMNRVLVAADIEPPFSSADISTSSASGLCWQECDDDYVWTVNSGEYLEACTNVMYISSKSRYDEDLGRTIIYSTQEFAFAIRVKCTEHLKENDTIVLEIDGANKAYEVGDRITIPVISAVPMYLTGGQTGNNTLTWRVSTTVEGTLDDFELVTDRARLTHGVIGGGGDLAWALTEVVTGLTSGATGTITRIESAESYIEVSNVSGAFINGETIQTPDTDQSNLTAVDQPAPYHWISGAKELTFAISNGVIAYVLGDTFSFSIEAGQFKWRQNGGAWSGAVDIESEVSLVDGLKAKFYPGPPPSFEVGDSYSFNVVQPYAPSHVKYPDWEYFDRNGGPVPTLFADLGGIYPISAVAVVAHLPASSLLTFQGSPDSFMITSWSQSLPWNYEDWKLVVAFFSSQNANQLRLIINATGWGKIYYWWAGEPLEISIPAQNLKIEDQYNMKSGLHIGSGQGGIIEWKEFLKQDDIDSIQEMIKHVKENNDEPVIFCPHYLHPTLSRLVKINTDRVAYSDIYQYHPDTSYEDHRFAVSLPMEGVTSWP